MTRARPGSKWSMDGQVQALGREPAGGKFSGMMCACMSTIISASVERQHGPRDLAGLHRAKRLVDVVQPSALRDHLVEQEPSLPVELEVAGNVRAEAVRAHPRGLHLALRANRHPGELDLRVGRQHAHDRRGAADRQALDSLTDERRVADRLEGVVHAGAAREGAHGLDRVVVLAVHDVGRPHPLGHLELRIEHVDPDDLGGAADARALHDREPDAAAAEHRDGLPRLEPGRPKRRADARKHAASHEGRAVQGQLGVDLHKRVLVEQHALGVARDPDELPERLAFLREPRRGGLGPGDDPADAEVWVAAQTLLAASAEAGEAGHHMVARPQRRHVRAHRLDDARALVAQDDGAVQREAPHAVDDVQIRVAHTGRRGADEDLTSPRLVDLDRLDGQSLVDFPKDGSLDLHGTLLVDPSSRASPAQYNPTSLSGGGMTAVEPTGQILGATVQGVDLAKPLSDADFATILQALGRHGVLRFPAQRLEAVELRDFSRRFGLIQATLTGRHHEPGMPEVGYLSNIIENGEPIGITDAGQDWHTDMSYNETIGFLNVLYAVKVPRRDGRVLGATAFVNTHAAYDELAPELKARLANATATHDFNKFWENMRRRPGSLRGPLTAEQRRRRPPSVHPLFLTHPITGRQVLYCNPGYAIRINELDEAESDRVLDVLFAHQLQPKYQYTHQWTEGDVLVWDHIGTLHNAIADYRPDEHRLMKRCQVMADRIFDPGFLREALSAVSAPAGAR